jgi:hypothetical protein
MGGIGSFERQTRCLYVGGIDINDHMELVIRKHFGEWGEIENVTIMQAKGVAFVRYKNLSNAEFAKEAMYAQSLEGGEIINVRWATDDPNPASIEAVKRKAESDVISAIKAKLPKIGSKGTILDYEDSYKQGISKKRVNNSFYDENQGRMVVSASSPYAVPEPDKDTANSIGILAGYVSSDEELE